MCGDDDNDNRRPASSGGKSDTNRLLLMTNDVVNSNTGRVCQGRRLSALGTLLFLLPLSGEKREQG